jgi:hypothetical protein
MNLETSKRKAGEKNNDENDDQQKSGKDNRQRQENDRSQKVNGTFLAGFGIRVHILDSEAWERSRSTSLKIKCRRLQDGAEIMVPANELIFIPGSNDADYPREMFKHRTRWHDPGDGEDLTNSKGVN